MKALKRLEIMGMGPVLEAARELSYDDFKTFCEGFVRSLSPAIKTIIHALLVEYQSKMKRKYKNDPSLAGEESNLLTLRILLS